MYCYDKIEGTYIVIRTRVHILLWQGTRGSPVGGYIYCYGKKRVHILL